MAQAQTIFILDGEDRTHNRTLRAETERIVTEQLTPEGWHQAGLMNGATETGDFVLDRVLDEDAFRQELTQAIPGVTIESGLDFRGVYVIQAY